MNDQKSLLKDVWFALVGDPKSEGSSLVGDFWNEIVTKANDTSMDFRLRQNGDGQMPEIEAPQAAPYHRSYDEIIAIQQAGSRGFRTIDIDPFIVTNDDYPCQISNSDLGQLVGFEDIVSPLTGGQGDQIVSPFWRTIPVTANGNWIKIEYLPSRVQDLDQGVKYTALTGSPTIGQQIPNQLDGPRYDAGTGQTRLDSGNAQWSQAQPILLQFDDQVGTILFAKHGDSFQIPFNTVYLTFKQWSPRIRVTVGYNCQIIANDDRDINSNLAFAGGRSLLSNPKYHYVPFTITAGDVAGAIDSNVGVAGTTLTRWELIRNKDQTSTATVKRPLNAGNALVFVDAVSFTSFSQYVEQYVNAIFGLYVVNNVTGTRVRRICEFHSSETSPAAGDDMGCHGSITFNIPRRVNLGKNESLYLYAKFIGTNNSIAVFFSVSGYSYSVLVGQNNPMGTNPLTPFIPMHYFAEDPYPMDFDSAFNAGSG